MVRPACRFPREKGARSRPEVRFAMRSIPGSPLCNAFQVRFEMCSARVHEQNAFTQQQRVPVFGHKKTRADCSTRVPGLLHEGNEFPAALFGVGPGVMRCQPHVFHWLLGESRRSDERVLGQVGGCVPHVRFCVVRHNVFSLVGGLAPGCPGAVLLTC